MKLCPSFFRILLLLPLNINRKQTENMVANWQTRTTRTGTMLSVGPELTHVEVGLEGVDDEVPQTYHVAGWNTQVIDGQVQRGN